MFLILLFLNKVPFDSSYMKTQIGLAEIQHEKAFYDAILLGQNV